MKIYIYQLFERFWHWMQVLLIFTLAITGLEIHGTFELFGYRTAVWTHDTASWSLIVLVVFAIFWHFTTGEWRQYKPSMKLLKEQIEYYITGIFKGAEHPTNKLVYNKFNPLQRFTYLGLKILVIPVMGITGLSYMYLNYPNQGFQLAGLDIVAYLHTAGAYILIVFVIAHVYLTTTGHKPLSAIIAMITGWEEVDEKGARAMLADELEVALKITKARLKTDSNKSELLDTALAETEEKLGVKKDEKFRNVVANSGAGYFRINCEGIYEEVNKAWASLYKFNSPEDVIGKHYSLSRSPEEFEELEITFNKVRKGETIPHGEVTRICQDGTVGHHTVTMTPVVQGKKVVGVEGFILDTTARLLAEKELLENKIRLEQILAERDGK
ncbi:MAG: cytochrome b/b6 domain-containing protein [Bacteroidales bacterium]|nr:cytochrome b/b6 domain-containing protein [Bacteroidales bacterium]